MADLPLPQQPTDEAPMGLPTGFGPSGRAGAPPVQRIRLTFTKGPELRYIGHLDLVRLWERAFRRARLPLAYTLGFTPHPRLSFAAPLALGATAELEVVDVYLTRPLALTELRAALDVQLPAGCTVRLLEEVPLEGPQPMALTRWAEYAVQITGAPPTDGQEQGDTDVETDDPAALAGTLSESQGSRWAAPARPGTSASPDAGGEHTHGGASPETEARRIGGGAGADAALQSTEGGAGAEAVVSEASQQGDELDMIPWRAPAHRLPPPAPPVDPPPPDELDARIAALVAASELPRERKREKKTVAYDLRPLVLDVWRIARPEHVLDAALLEQAGDHPGTAWLGMTLRLDSNGAGRPEEVAAALGTRARLIHRLRIGLEDDPLPEHEGQ